MDKQKKRISRKDTKRLIIEAAYKEFSEKGYDGARMQKIAQRANINKAMLHYYFKDKETLYETVIEYFHDLFNRIIEEENIQAKGRITFLQNTVEAYYKIFFEYSDFRKIFIQELANGLKTMKKILTKQNPKEFHNILEKFFLLTKIKELQTQKEIRSDIEPEQIMLSIVGLMGSTLIQTMVICNLLDYDDKELEKFIEKRKRSIILILDKGLTP
ncbi:MAG: TetR/AcrR family transcriptional regulator [Leptonema sp. (in: bacteria)]